MKAQVASWAGSLEPYGFKLETPNFKSKCSSGQCAPDSVPMALFGCKNDQSDEKRFQVRTKGRETQGWHQPSAAGLLSNRNTGEDYKLGLTRALGQRKNQDSTRRDMQNRRAVLSFDLRCREACRGVDLNWGSNTNASVGPFEHAKHAAIPAVRRHASRALKSHQRKHAKAHTESVPKKAHRIRCKFIIWSRRIREQTPGSKC